MKKILKNISKKLLKHFWLYPFVQKYMLLCKKYSNNFDDQNLLNQIRVALKILPYLRFVIGKGDSLLERKADIFQKTCKRMKIFVSPKDSFMYTIDPFVLPIYRVNDEMIPIGNLTINYSRVFKKGFKQIEEEIRKEINLRDLDSSQEIFLKSLLKVLKGVETIRERYLKELKKLKKKVKGVDLEKIEDLIILLSRVPMNPSQSFKEALQSILFVNSLIWTC